MSKYKDFIGKPDTGIKGQRIVNQQETLGGRWNCGQCGVKVLVAVLDRKENTLSWTCPEGHETKIPFEL